MADSRAHRHHHRRRFRLHEPGQSRHRGGISRRPHHARQSHDEHGRRTDEACDLLQGVDARDRIGCHLNLAEGVPLTDAMRRSKTFCSDGEFNEPLARRRFFPLSPADKRALADETRAQIAAVRSRGFSVSHLDSHRYVHTMPNIAAVVVAVAREMGIARVRPYANCGPTFTGVRGVGQGDFQRAGWHRTV